MGWLDRFKTKNLPDCLTCGKKIKGDKFSQVKYRYGMAEGEIGTALLCEKCSNQYLNDKDDKEHGEPI
jgi:hypothetical protein